MITIPWFFFVILLLWPFIAILGFVLFAGFIGWLGAWQEKTLHDEHSCNDFN